MVAAEKRLLVLTQCCSDVLGACFGPLGSQASPGPVFDRGVYRNHRLRLLNACLANVFSKIRRGGIWRQRDGSPDHVRGEL